MKLLIVLLFSPKICDVDEQRFSSHEIAPEID